MAFDDKDLRRRNSLEKSSSKCSVSEQLAEGTSAVAEAKISKAADADRENLRFGEPPLQKPKSFGFRCQKSADAKKLKISPSKERPSEGVGLWCAAVVEAKVIWLPIQKSADVRC